MVAREIASQPRENLRLSGQTAKGTRVKNAGAVACKGRAVGMVRLGMHPGRKGAFAIDSDASRQRIIQFC